MMKKLLALCMAAVMLLCAVTALADEITINYDEGMDIVQVVPEGYTVDYEILENGILSVTMLKDENSIGIAMLIAADADHDDTIKLNDLTDDEKKAFAEALFEDLDEESWSIMTTGQGTEAVVFKTTEDAYSMAMISTLYYGYDVVMYVSNPDGSELDDEDMTLAMQFLTDLSFVVKTVE